MGFPVTAFKAACGWLHTVVLATGDSSSFVETSMGDIMGYFQIIPNDIIKIIIKDLQFKDLINLGKTNSVFKQLTDDDTLWEREYRRVYPYRIHSMNNELYRELFANAWLNDHPKPIQNNNNSSFWSRIKIGKLWFKSVDIRILMVGLDAGNIL